MRTLEQVNVVPSALMIECKIRLDKQQQGAWAGSIPFQEPSLFALSAGSFLFLISSETCSSDSASVSPSNSSPSLASSSSTTSCHPSLHFLSSWSIVPATLPYVNWFFMTLYKTRRVLAGNSTNTRYNRLPLSRNRFCPG